MELHIIDSLHNDDSDHEVKNFYNKQNDNQITMGPCHACNNPHLVRDCNESICNRCSPNLDKHMLAKCIRKGPFNRSKYQSPLIIITALEINLMATVTQMCNCLFPPLNWTILLNCWKPQRK